MTKLESLQKLLLLWQWLDEHPCTPTEDAYIVLGLEPDVNDCLACAYADQFSDDENFAACSHCPVWPSERAPNCYHGASEFWHWKRHNDAGPMLALIRQRLKEHGE